jgi:hypothetical protein
VSVKAELIPSLPDRPTLLSSTSSRRCFREACNGTSMTFESEVAYRLYGQKQRYHKDSRRNVQRISHKSQSMYFEILPDDQLVLYHCSRTFFDDRRLRMWCCKILRRQNKQTKCFKPKHVFSVHKMRLLGTGSSSC